MEHIITNADLQQMLAAKDPKDRIVCCSENGTQYVIDELGRDAQRGRILIKFHGDTSDRERIESLEESNIDLELDKTELTKRLETRDEEIAELKKQIVELKEKATHES